MTNTNTNKVTGYTFEEMMDFGFYDWTLISSEPTSIPDDWKGCEYYEDCPCCNCGEEVVVKERYARPRWSKSGKQMVEDTTYVWSCVAHKG